MRFFRLFPFFLFGVFLICPSAFADTLSPTVLFYEVEPGEEFEFDVVFKSEAGGEYDVLQRSLTFAPEGEKKYEDIDADVLDLGSDLLSFSAGEQRYIPVKVRIPSDAVTGDVNYVISFRQRTEASHRFELSTVVVFSVGGVVDPQAELSSAEFRFDAGDPEVLQGVDYQLLNRSGRAFVAAPELEFFDAQGRSQLTLKGLRKVFFPFDPEASIFLFRSDEEIVLGQDHKKAVFRVVVSDDFRWEQELVNIPAAAKIFPQEKVDFPLGLRYRERRAFDFLYHPIFKGFAILIGLTLIAVSFLMGRKKS